MSEIMSIEKSKRLFGQLRALERKGSNSDQRAHHRHATKLIAAVRYGEGSQRRGTIANLSARGLMFEAENENFLLHSQCPPFAVGDVISVVTRIPRTKQYLTLEARVNWVKTGVFRDQVGLRVVKGNSLLSALCQRLTGLRYEAVLRARAA